MKKNVGIALLLFIIVFGAIFYNASKQKAVDVDSFYENEIEELMHLYGLPFEKQISIDRVDYTIQLENNQELFFGFVPGGRYYIESFGSYLDGVSKTKRDLGIICEINNLFSCDYLRVEDCIVFLDRALESKEGLIPSNSHLTEYIDYEESFGDNQSSLELFVYDAAPNAIIKEENLRERFIVAGRVCK